MRRTYFGALSDEQASTRAARADIAGHAHGRSDWFRTHMPAWLMPLLNLDGTRVVEVGCGTGSQSAVMAEQGALVLGIDVSTARVDAARQRCQVLGITGAEFVQREASAVNDEVRARGPFETALLFAVLEHQRPLERLATLRACWESLVPGGHLIIRDTPNRLTWTDRHTSLLPFFLTLPEDVARVRLVLAQRRTPGRRTPRTGPGLGESAAGSLGSGSLLP